MHIWIYLHTNTVKTHIYSDPNPPSCSLWKITHVWAHEDWRLFYFQLISSVDPKFLKLTKLDDKIYSSFRETFKELDVKRLKEDDLKSDEAKEVSGSCIVGYSCSVSVVLSFTFTLMTPESRNSFSMKQLRPSWRKQVNLRDQQRHLDELVSSD